MEENKKSKIQNKSANENDFDNQEKKQKKSNEGLLLAVDVGNTNITLGVFWGEEIWGTFRLTTSSSRTSDEYGIVLRELLRAKNLDPDDVNGVIISSVVPNIMYSFVNGIKKYFGVEPVIVGVGIKTGIKIMTKNPAETGADRIVDAVAAYELYGGPVIVIDFGTATTYDYVSADGSFMAGVTSPGLRTSANALWKGTARLPEIEIKKPESILARDTVTSMQAGVVYGYIGQTEYIIRRMKQELGLPEMKVIATGGLGKIISDSTQDIDIFDSKLTLIGLRLIYEKNCVAE